MQISSLLSVALALAAAFTIDAQSVAEWSEDAAANAPIGDANNDQVQAKIVIAPDGSSYISWFDNRTGGYDVYLQRLDADGNELWAHNGILVADRGFSSTQDYDLDIDTTGHALLAFRDDRFGGTDVTAARIAPDGTLVWGVNGVQLATGAGFVANPKITGATDGGIIVAWRHDNDVRLQKLNTAGVEQWGVDTILTGAGGLTPSDLDASTDDSAIIALVRGFMGADLLGQKVDASGNVLWGANHVVVYDVALQIGNFPQIVPDGNGGAIFAWYGVSPGLQCYAQRVLSDGTEKFAHNGLAVAAVAGRDRVAPSVSYRSQTDDIFVFWREQIPGPTIQDGVYGQRINSNAVLTWGAGGKAIAPIGNRTLTQITSAHYQGGAFVSYVETVAFGNQLLKTARVDVNGDAVWGSTTTTSSAPSGKSRTIAALNPCDYLMLAWSDQRDDGGDIYVQNVKPDGALGPIDVPGDANGDKQADVFDMLAVLETWGPCDQPCPPNCVEDVNDDCEVDVFDLLEVLDNWS